METNYYSDIISPDSDRLLSSILFIRPPGDNHVILIVEGGTDFKFYSNCICDEKYILTSDFRDDISEGRKGKVIETIMKANEEGIEGVIGLIDADFDNLSNISTEENLYRTDTHDLEAMLIKSKRTLKKVLIRYSKDRCLIPDLDISKIQSIILSSSKYIGYALWCSNNYRWRIDFKKFPINQCIDNSCRLNIEKMCEILSKRATSGEISSTKIKLEVCKKLSEQWDIWQVCRGKEMIRVLAHYISFCLKNCSVRYDDLVHDLILAFEKDDFFKTNLYSSLMKWQNKNKNYLLFDM